MNKINVLVTGCGGDIGQSIGKILINFQKIDNLIGADINGEHPSKFIYPKTKILPRCDSSNYLEALKEIIIGEKIDLVIPVSEAEIRFFFQNRITEILNAKLLISNYKALKVGLDKYETIKFLKENNLLFPITSIVKETERFDLPCIVKKRMGVGGKDLHVVRDNFDFDYFKLKYPDFIFQELILPDDEEYTCGVYRNHATTKYIIIKRKLTGGFTSSGIVVKNEQIEKLLMTIAEKVELCGSINVQLRFNEKGPFVFEINPRFSSTVLFRHLLGFKDLIWAFEYEFGISSDFDLAETEGRKIFKGYQEYLE